MSALKVCIIASEMMPYAKTGGLADVTGALARRLAGAGHAVRAFVPYYESIRAGYPGVAVPDVQKVPVQLGTHRYEFSLVEQAHPAPGPTVYFVDCPALFSRGQLYTNDPDEHRRFILFTRAVIESCQRLGFGPDVFHCNDWHTAFLPLFLKSAYAWDRLFAGSRTVMTLHNIGYQGEFSSREVDDLGAGVGRDLLHQDDLRAGRINPLKAGILFADAVTTVSPTYAVEIRTTELGMGMQAALAARAGSVTGILNGVDYEEWDPRVDPHLSNHFHLADLRGKMRNKRRLLERSGLAPDAQQPLVTMVTRLAEQKGIDLLFDALPALLAERPFGLVVLGAGDERYERFFTQLAARHASRVAFHRGYDEPLAHLIEAGGDAFLMPSRYEPCGLNQMYSLRYGNVPIVRRTGGLADSVQHFDPGTGKGTGIVFDHFDAPAVRWALNTALDWFADQRLWRRIMRNAMAQDFSWSRQVLEYEQLYRSLLGTTA
ncbi:MAG: glycogen/starch synthase [Steroidobacteraceae bacterium]